MGLVSYTYWPTCIEAPLKPQISRELKVTSDQDLVEHLNQLSIEKAVLVITTTSAA